MLADDYPTPIEFLRGQAIAFRGQADVCDSIIERNSKPDMSPELLRKKAAQFEEAANRLEDIA